MVKILILGGSGMIGSFLKGYLESRFSVEATSTTGRKGFLKFDTSREDTYSIFNKPYDVVIDCMVTYQFASKEQIPHDASTKENILRLLSQNGTHYIAISSISATPDNKDRSDYNLSKYLTEEAIKRFGESFGVPYTILRFAQVFDRNGSAQRSQKALYYFVDCFRRNLPLRLLGDPNRKRSYIPIEILAEAVEKAMAERIFGVHNVLMPDAYSSRELIDAWRSLTPLSPANLEFDLDQPVSEYVIPECSKVFKDFLKDKTCKSYFKQLLLGSNENA